MMPVAAKVRLRVIVILSLSSIIQDPAVLLLVVTYIEWGRASKTEMVPLAYYLLLVVPPLVVSYIRCDRASSGEQVWKLPNATLTLAVDTVELYRARPSKLELLHFVWTDKVRFRPHSGIFQPIRDPIDHLVAAPVVVLTECLVLHPKIEPVEVVEDAVTAIVFH
jgi:hypothetical protein